MEPRKFILRSEFVRTHLIEFLKRLPIERLVEVTIKPFAEKRSVRANARLWLLHNTAAKNVGCSPEDMHEDMLCMFTGVKAEVRLPSGSLKRIPNERSSDMNTKRFAQFMEQVEAFYISELGVWLDQEAA